MRKQWKRLAVILGVAILVVSQSNFVLAEEKGFSVQETQGQEKEVEEETYTEDEIVKTGSLESKEARTGDEKSISGEVKPADNLRWDNATGIGYFDNPNDSTVWWYAYLYKEGDNMPRVYYSNNGQVAPIGPNQTEQIHLFNLFDGPGTYRFTVTFVRDDIDPCTSGYSQPYLYVMAEKSLDVPNMVFLEEGKVRVELSENDVSRAYFSEFTYQVIRSDGETVYWGGNPDDQSLVQEKDFTENIKMELGYEYYAIARAISNDLSQCNSSDWSERMKIGGSLSQINGSGSASNSSSQAGDSDSASDSFLQTGDFGNNFGSGSGSSFAEETKASEVWKPTTPDEIKRYAVYGKEKVDFTTDAKSSYPISIYNAMQGPLCFNSFEAVLGDYIIGRTYNILPNGKMVYKMDKKAKITLNIPAALQKADRDFKMICVTEKGRAVVLQDLDSDSNTITFETDTYYAFALVYKDAK